MAKSVAFSIDRLVVVSLDEDMDEDEAIRNARMYAADEFGRMMDRYDEDDEETIIVLETYDDEEEK